MLILTWLKRQFDLMFASPRSSVVLCPIPVSTKQGNHGRTWAYEAFKTTATNNHSRQRRSVT